MSFGPSMSHEINGTPVKKGATWSRPAHLPSLTIVIRCDGVQPDVFTAGVFLGNREVARTNECEYDRAEAAAHSLIEDAFARLFK